MSDAAPEGARSVAALVLGAGQGKRLGYSLPKAFVLLEEQTLIERSIAALARSGAIGWIQPVLDPAEFDRFAALPLCAAWPELEGAPAGLESIQLARPVAGGAERQDSVRAGLQSLPSEIEWVAIHDAARCVVSAGDISRVVEAARQCGAAILAEPVRDTIKRVARRRIVETPPREECWSAQTPQVARRDWLEEAMAQANRTGRLGTDDAELLEWAGYPVEVVSSNAPNLKITRPEDLAAAEAILRGAARDAR